MGVAAPLTSINAATSREVADGVYAYMQPDGSWFLNNTGFVVGRRTVVAIDATSTEARTRRLIESIDRIAKRRAGILVNTHHHGDHTYGNYLFGDATIVAHDLCRTEMQQLVQPSGMPYWTGVDWGDIEIVPPTLTYEDKITLHVDDLRCEVRYVGTPAHTTNDSFVWIPERSVLFCGDLLFNGGTPFLLMGSIAGALEVLEQMKGIGAATIVPGHGEVCDARLIEDVEKYLRFVQQLARDGKDNGMTPLETARDADLGEFARLLDAERIVGNLYRAYAELEGRPRGCKIDEEAALTAMVTFNGGQPLTCHA
jgi:cyclase